MKALSVLAVVGWLAAAQAQETPSTPAGATAGPVQEDATDAGATGVGLAARRLQLRAAVQRYQLGEFEAALASLADLVVAPDISEPLRREARVYMAELLLTQGDREGAERS